MDSIDVEEDSVLTAIFKDAFPEGWVRDPNFIHYLSELSSYGVEKLAQEPDRLSEEKSQILEETQNLAFQNYKTFIQTAECSREIFEDFQIIEQHVEDLLGKLPVFAEQCNEVLKKAQDITCSRRMNSLTLQRHTQLLEILELPQLMDTCVRNGYYDEALELAAHVKRLEKKHSSIPVIASIVNEVKLSTQLMLKQLIQQLRTNVQLPACLRVIGYLRRMDVFTEVELRIKFLQARDSWFQGILDVIPKEDAYTHITKTIEASRVNLFDIITQYRAIFSDEDPLLSSSKDDTLNEGALFHTWIVQKVSQFLQTLEGDLARGVGGRLDSILGQCMYFGLSFSRVGADFRSLLTPIFQQAALSGLRVALTMANKRFDESMRSYSLLSSSAGMSGLPYNPASQTGQLYPPTVLLEFHPLAAYCNDILTALNELRLCSPVAMVTEVCDSLFESFVNINKVILGFHRAEETTFDRKEKNRFDDFCAAYAHSLIPYINKCLQALYPPSQLAQVLGVTISEMHKMGCIGQVDTASALKNIKHLIPEVEVEVVLSEPVQDSTFTEPVQAPPFNELVQAPPSSEPVQAPPFTEPAQAPPFTEPVQAPPFTEPVQAPPFTEPVQVHPFTEPVQAPTFTEGQQEISATKPDEIINTLMADTTNPLASAPLNYTTPDIVQVQNIETDQSGQRKEHTDETNKIDGTKEESSQQKLELVTSQSESEEVTSQPEHPVKAQFILHSDTDDEIDIDKQPAIETMLEGNEDVADEIDIESDLSALAADVLGTKSPSDGGKKND